AAGPRDPRQSPARPGNWPPPVRPRRCPPPCCPARCAATVPPSCPVTADRDAALTGPRVEGRVPAVRAEPLDQAFHQRQVHPADELAVLLRELVERAVPQPDDAVGAAAGLISLLGQHAFHVPPGRVPLARGRAERAAQL